MIKKQMYIEDIHGFTKYRITVHATYHAGTTAEIRNGHPIECDDNAVLEIHHIILDGIKCPIEKVADWIGIPVNDLEEKIKDAIMLDIDDLPF